MEEDKVMQNEPMTEYGLDATGTVAAEKAEYMDQVPLTSEETPRDEDEDLPKSSIENIIPLQNLKRGWFTISAFVAQTASAAATKTNEALNSEEFLAMKQKASDAVAPAWERTVEVAAPIWEKTKTTVSVVVEKTNETAVDAIEKTKESMAVMAEQMKPTVETVSNQVKVAATEGWQKLSAAASTAAEYTSETVNNIKKEWTDVHGRGSTSPNGGEHHEGSASAMDAATRGGPMTI